MLTVVAQPSGEMVVMGIATRVNGVAPPEVPLSEIDLGSAEFWREGDDVRDGAFATLRREAPVSFWGEPPAPGFEEVRATGR